MDNAPDDRDEKVDAELIAKLDEIERKYQREAIPNWRGARRTLCWIGIPIWCIVIPSMIFSHAGWLGVVAVAALPLVVALGAAWRYRA